MSAPSKITFPESGFSNPPRMRKVVVLPQPLGPRRVRNSFSPDGEIQFIQDDLIPETFGYINQIY